MMSTRRHRFKQRDVTRACKGIRALGLDIAEARIDERGQIIVIPRPRGKDEPQAEGDNPWDGAR
jgi:hypothetical protein